MADTQPKYVTISKEKYKHLLSIERAYSKITRVVRESTVEEVVADFEKTDLYSAEFVKDLNDGLKKSSYTKRKK